MAEKFSICPKNDGFAKLRGLQPPSPLAHTLNYEFMMCTHMGRVFLFYPV